MNAVELKNYIIENDKIEDILIALGCHKLRRNDNEIRCALPNHNNPTSVRVKLDTLSTTVFSDDMPSKGDIYTFIMDLKKIKFIDSIKLIHNILGLEFSKFNKEPEVNKIDLLSVFKMAKSIANAQVYKKQELEVLEEISNEYIFLPHINWLREGILPFACKRFNIGYDIRSKRILIPHRLWCGGDNDYVGIIGRTTIKNYDLLDIPKYYPLVPYPKSMNVYGLQENYKTIQEKGVVSVFESEKSVLKRYSKKDGTAVAVCGSDISNQQVSILLSLNVDIVIQMDKGVTLQHIRSLCEKFYLFRTVYYVYDYNNLLEPKESPADAESKIYDTLFDNKILYDEKEHQLYLKGLKQKG